MRIIRLEQQPAKVSDDIRAGLASIGRGAAVVGGVALVGVRPPEFAQVVDAVVILPRGLLIVVGVDLPDPAIRLEAPLRGQWKADGWPLVRQDEVINPATEALALSERIADRLRQSQHQPPTIGTVVAVGPYVETVDQPATDLAGAVRVLYPTATAMLAATVSLGSAKEPFTVDQVGTFMSILAPQVQPPTAAALSAEGFTEGRDEPLEHPLFTTEVTEPADAVPASSAAATARPAPEPASQAPRPPGPQAAAASSPAQGTPAPPPHAPAPAAPPRAHEPRGSMVATLVPIGAVTLLAVLLIAAIVVAAVQAPGSTTEPAAAPPNPTGAPQPNSGAGSPGSTVDGIAFTPVAAKTTENCAPHAFGDIRVSLADLGCMSLRRASFTATVGDRDAAASIAVIGFGTTDKAQAFKAVADTPGTGAVSDVATATGAWPGQVPTFAGAAYASTIDGATVRIVRSGWLDGSTDPEDAALTAMATAALQVPFPS